MTFGTSELGACRIAGGVNPAAAAGPAIVGRMAIKRMDNVLIVVDEIVQYEDLYRLCFLRGPEGIIIGLAEQIV